MINILRADGHIDHVYYKKIFRQVPQNYLLIDIDDPKFTMLDITQYHLDAIGVTRDYVIGKGVFEAFPDNPKQQYSNSENLRNSFLWVIETKESHSMAPIRYDVEVNGKFESKYWKVTNYPVFENGEVVAIFNYAIDITDILMNAKF